MLVHHCRKVLVPYCRKLLVHCRAKDDTDTISPDRIDPQTRNRYSYTLNNPLKYTDPTGYCTQYPTSVKQSEENQQCVERQSQLNQHGFFLENIWDWGINELDAVLAAIYDLMTAADWTAQNFMDAVGPTILVRDREYKDSEGNSYSGWQIGRTIWLYDSAFSKGFKEAKRVIVHEIAHRWDAQSGLSLSVGMAWLNTNDGYPSEYAKKDAQEDWAESVTALVYPDQAVYQNPNGSPRIGNSRRLYVRRAMCGARGAPRYTCEQYAF